VKVVFGRVSEEGEVRSARWSWWRTAVRSCGVLVFSSSFNSAILKSGYMGKGRGMGLRIAYPYLVISLLK